MFPLGARETESHEWAFEQKGISLFLCASFSTYFLSSEALKGQYKKYWAFCFEGSGVFQMGWHHDCSCLSVCAYVCMYQFNPNRSLLFTQM